MINPQIIALSQRVLKMINPQIIALNQRVQRNHRAISQRAQRNHQVKAVKARRNHQEAKEEADYEKYIHYFNNTNWLTF